MQINLMDILESDIALRGTVERTMNFADIVIRRASDHIIAELINVFKRDVVPLFQEIMAVMIIECPRLRSMPKYTVMDRLELYSRLFSYTWTQDLKHLRAILLICIVISTISVEWLTALKAMREAEEYERSKEAVEDLKALFEKCRLQIVTTVSDASDNITIRPKDDLPCRQQTPTTGKEDHQSAARTTAMRRPRPEIGTGAEKRRLSTGNAHTSKSMLLTPAACQYTVVHGDQSVSRASVTSSMTTIPRSDTDLSACTTPYKSCESHSATMPHLFDNIILPYNTVAQLDHLCITDLLFTAEIEDAVVVVTSQPNSEIPPHQDEEATSANLYSTASGPLTGQTPAHPITEKTPHDAKNRPSAAFESTRSGPSTGRTPGTSVTISKLQRNEHVIITAEEWDQLSEGTVSSKMEEMLQKRENINKQEEMVKPTASRKERTVPEGFRLVEHSPWTFRDNTRNARGQYLQKNKEGAKDVSAENINKS